MPGGLGPRDHSTTCVFRILMSRRRISRIFYVKPNSDPENFSCPARLSRNTASLANSLLIPAIQDKPYLLSFSSEFVGPFRTASCGTRGNPSSSAVPVVDPWKTVSTMPLASLECVQGALAPSGHSLPPYPLGCIPQRY